MLLGPATYRCQPLAVHVTLLPQSQATFCKSYAFTACNVKSFPIGKRQQRCVLCQASSGTLSRPKSGYLSNSFADQDIFLIAGAGIAGLAMAAALTKVGSSLDESCHQHSKTSLARDGYRLGFPVESWKERPDHAKRAVQLAYGLMLLEHWMPLVLQTCYGNSTH